MLTIYVIETNIIFASSILNDKFQQYLPFTVCAEGCEAAEEPSDDEGRTSQVPERSEGKTKMIRKQFLPFTVLKLLIFEFYFSRCISVATALTVYGMRRRV